MDRRQFLKNASAAAAALSLPWGSSIITPKASRADFDDPRVVIVRDAAAHVGSQIDAEIAQVMMDEAIRRYTGYSDLSTAYQSVFPGITESSVIGIKVNCINNSLSTHPLAVEALTNGLQQMQFGGNYFAANNIIVWDRTN
ncbi:twin-arginine translocation signal domain-containing protein, partial [bacterium]|nr:twin-arginine translocation signal domain-containing protein [bacterium]